MNPLGFKRSVLVHAITMRVVGYNDEGVERFKIPQANDLPWFDAKSVGDWPGEPVYLEWDLPKGPRFDLEPSLNGKPMVRWRRHQLDDPHDGVVLGTSWRQEGVLDENTLAGPKRMISLYEVGLRPPRRASRALIVLVHPQDLQVIEEQERGVPAPTRVGVGGRLGGGAGR